MLPKLRPGLRLYCIGDIHGRADLLLKVREQIAADLAKYPAPNSRIICLGDYIDRGPDSAGVLELFASGEFPAPLTLLRGNHEVMLAKFLQDPNELGTWRRYGGLDTLKSYGVDVTDPGAGLGYEEARQSLIAHLPQRHRKVLESTETRLAIDDYFFCHAGVRPGVPLDQQRGRDLLWIRGDFLSSTDDFGKVVVHGHTPVPRAEVLPNRINIDTGAFASGRLTCLVLEGSSRSFLSGG